jgi:hypothetical protein
MFIMFVIIENSLKRPVQTEQSPLLQLSVPSIITVATQSTFRYGAVNISGL